MFLYSYVNKKVKLYVYQLSSALDYFSSFLCIICLGLKLLSMNFNIIYLVRSAFKMFFEGVIEMLGTIHLHTHAYSGESWGKS